MDNIYTSFIVIIIILIAVSISAKHFGKAKLYMIVKPLNMIFIIALPLMEVR